MEAHRTANIELSFDDFLEKYKPIQNPSGTAPYVDDVAYGFETFGTDFERVSRHDPMHVWTIVEGDNVWVIVAGLHIVNRLAYLITTQAHSCTETVVYGADDV